MGVSNFSLIYHFYFLSFGETLIYHFSFLSPSLRETARYRLKYYLKGPLSPKQPTNQPCCRCGIMVHVVFFFFFGFMFYHYYYYYYFTLVYPVSPFPRCLGGGSVWSEILSQRAVNQKHLTYEFIVINSLSA